MDETIEGDRQLSLVDLFNKTFSADASVITVALVQDFHKKTLNTVTEFLKFSGITISSIDLGKAAITGHVSGFTTDFKTYFKANTGGVVNITLKSWFDFYREVGIRLQPALEFTGQKWDDWDFEKVELTVKPVSTGVRAIYDIRTQVLELGARAENALISEKIRHIGTLIQCPENELLKLPNFGRKSLGEVRIALKEKFGLTLNADVGDWKPPTE